MEFIATETMGITRMGSEAYRPIQLFSLLVYSHRTEGLYSIKTEKSSL